MEAEATTNNRRARRPLPAPSTTTMLLAAALAAVRTGEYGNLALGFSAAPARRVVVPGTPSSIAATAAVDLARFDGGTFRRSPPLLLATPRGADGDASDDGEEEGREASRAEEVIADDSPIVGSSKTAKKFSRESLRKLGVSALLAYSFVSGACGAIAVSCAWFVFSKKTGTSPLANKPGFLAVYAGFTAVLHLIRPARFALSVAISPYFERVRRFFRRRFGVGPKRASTLVVVCFNLLGVSALMVLGVGLASALSGVPAWAVR